MDFVYVKTSFQSVLKNENFFHFFFYLVWVIEECLKRLFMEIDYENIKTIHFQVLYPSTHRILYHL